MAKVSLQFHAAPHELLAWASTWAAEHQLNMVVERFFPETRCVAVQGVDVTGAIEQLDGVWNRIWFSRDSLIVEHSADPPLHGQPECMVLHVGDMVPNGLRESAVGAVSDDAAALRMWRNIIKSMKSHLRRGAWVSNPVSGARQRANHYFTKGALAMNQSGVRMLAAAGWGEFELDDRE